MFLLSSVTVNKYFQGIKKWLTNTFLQVNR